MTELVYPWRRFWYPRGGQISLADQGFLLDPESKYAKYYAKDVAGFESINDIPCLVLLGEPGMGKSTALKVEFKTVKDTISGSNDSALWFDLRNYSSDERLERKVFQDETLQKWRGGTHTLHLFFDSLDEGLLRIDNISRVLLSEIEKLPIERLRLRIASRPADWQVTLENGFVGLWGKKKACVFELAPLRKVDVSCAAQMTGIDDPDSFVDQIIRKDVVPLAFKPVTLQLLLAVFAKNRALPESRSDLYFEGCKRLCEEPSPDRRDSPMGRGKLAVGQRLAIAARFAAVTQFLNRSAVWTGPEQGLEPEDVSLTSLMGGSEGGLTDYVRIDMNALREVLDTGLFSSLDLSRQGWRHQTYAEYLAAYYLTAHKVPLESLRSLMLHPDGSGKVTPQLRETARWLAGMNAQVFQLLVQSDPEVLLKTDLAMATHADRAKLARRLLESFASGAILKSPWDGRQDFRDLDNPELVDIVQPYLREESRGREARIVAVDIVRSCHLNTLVGELGALALDPNEPVDLRVNAAAAVADIGDSSAKASLRPLALGAAGGDPRDDLKGYGLIATWPAHIAPTELFLALTPPKDESYYGAYKKFLDSGIVKQIESSDILAGVVWARQYTKGHDDTAGVQRLAADILVRAIEEIDQPGLAAQLALALFERMQDFRDSNRITEKLRASGDSVRRQVARAMFSVAAADKHGAFTLMDVCAIDAHDIPWLLIELSLTPSAEIHRLISEVISRKLVPEDIDQFAAVWIAASGNDYLRAAIEPLVRPVALDSPEATRMKEDYERSVLYASPKAVTPTAPLAQSLSELLASDSPDIFCRVDWLLLDQKGDVNHAEPLPGWADLDDAVRSQILSVARAYLATRPSGLAGAWGLEGTSSQGMLSGYRALRLLALQSPDSLDELTDTDWNFWTPIVITYLSSGTDIPSRTLLLIKAYQNAADVFHSTFGNMVDAEDQRHGHVFVVNNIAEVWDDELAAILRAKITTGSLKPDSFKSVLAKLLKMNDGEAKLLARQLATDVVPSQGEQRSRAVVATAELLSHDPQEWKVVWPVFKGNVTFGTAVLEVVASEHEYSSFANALDEDEVADICIWLSSLGLEKEYDDPEDPGLVTPRVALARWWNILINALAHRGSAGACRAIQRLIDALPQYPGLKWSLKEAEERSRRASWVPLTPENVIGLTAGVPELVISLHGIRTRGVWQKEVNTELQKNGFRHELLDYGYFLAARLLIASQRARQIDWFRGEYERLVGDSGIKPCVIAHSFGTYLVAMAMEKYVELKFDRIIFCGSIVRTDYDWDSLVNAGRVNAVLNQYGGQDAAVRLGAWAIADTGQSGVVGFDTSNPNIHQELRPRFRHSDYFYSLNYRESWIPFLKGSDPSGCPPGK